jgi:hypothetical protein
MNDKQFKTICKKLDKLVLVCSIIGKGKKDIVKILKKSPVGKREKKRLTGIDRRKF